MVRFRIWVEGIRDRTAERIRGVIGGAEGEIAAALVVGVRAGIPEDINEAMRRSGIYHIISISGLHMALVAGIVMGTLRALFAFFPGFASRHPIKKYAAAIALVGIAFYLFISGGEVAAQRSFIMLAIMLIALLFDRAALTMRNLAISAIIVIAIAPHEVIGPSFQMSFAATAALVGAYALWSERRRGGIRAGGEKSKTGIAVRKLWGLVVGLAVTSVVAGLATAAFGAYHFQRVSPLSLLANLAVMPVVSLVVMPFGVAGAIAMPLGLDGPFFAVMGKGLGLMITLSKWFSDRTPIDAVGLVSVHSIAFLTLALILATMATTWLRLAALPFAVIGLLTLGAVPTPDAFVSEDGRLLAMAMGDGRIAVSRARPNQFTIENWQHALRAETVLKPEKATDDTTLAGEIDDLSPGTGFICGKDLCAARHTSGAMLALAATIEVARSMCGKATLIVLTDPTARNICRGGGAKVITTRELARSGSATIHFSLESEEGVEVKFARAPPYRPWHAQRAFARAARGLLPYQRNRADPAAKPSDSPVTIRSNASRAADQPRACEPASGAAESQ
jgi:competence protein ComEC